MKRLSQIIFLVLITIGGLVSSCDSKNSAKEENAYYTCPMHPEIKKDEPGQCPICNMDLVKKEK